MNFNAWLKLCCQSKEKKMAKKWVFMKYKCEKVEMKSLLFLFWFGMVTANMAFAGGAAAPEPSAPPAPAKWANITLTGEDAPLLEGTIWTSSQSDPANFITMEFRSGGRLIWRNKWSNGQTVTNDWTWQREGDVVRAISEGGFVFYEGKYYPATQRIMLTAEDSEGATGDFTWELSTGSSIPNSSQGGATPSGSSSPPSPQQAQKTYVVTITFEVGGSGATMTMPYTVQAGSAQEAQILAEGQWRNTNFSNNKFLHSAVTGSY
jgi:hypothetical protein